MKKIIRKNTLEKFPPAELIQDYETAFLSREASLLGRKEVLSGKAKFGIFGDGKELAQIAMAKFFKPGDWRSGYYRDQTFMFATKTSNPLEFFAQLYADTDLSREPHSGGRQMNCHYGSRLLDNKGKWQDQTKNKNTTSDISSTGGQMARLLGLGYASKLYREVPELKNSKETYKKFTNSGQELAFGTIGNASTSEGIFWEVMNACGVLQLPVLTSIWDDDYGISVPAKYQTTKESISEIMEGFRDKGDGKGGFEIFKVEGYDYQKLYETYEKATKICREQSKPCLVHVTHITQPQGHSTSGSHERYKDEERLNYEKETDCLKVFREALLAEKIISEKKLVEKEKNLVEEIFSARTESFNKMQEDFKKEQDEAVAQLKATKETGSYGKKLEEQQNLSRKLIHKTLRQAVLSLKKSSSSKTKELERYCKDYGQSNEKIYRDHLFYNNEYPAQIKHEKPIFSSKSKTIDSRLIICNYFDLILKKHSNFFIIGEDVGALGGVNLEFDGLQEKYGKLRVTDTGIREASILGQGIGSALRGLRPLVDIQYLDYLIYCLQGLTDDLATLHYRTRGGQVAPLIVRTKGHRLEGIWHTGSPMSMLLGSLRGMHICVPRNSVQACGLYATLMQMKDPALLIEVLNGYRLKEKCPDNLGTYTVELGVPEVLKTGTDITIVTYGACVRVAEEACKILEDLNISIELIDIQTLLPFDTKQIIAESLAKTNAVIFMDEDVPGGATAFMMQEVLEKQNAYDYLDAKPRTITASANRSAYASDGDYYCKPSVEDLVELAYDIMEEREPSYY